MLSHSVGARTLYNILGRRQCHFLNIPFTCMIIIRNTFIIKTGEPLPATSKLLTKNTYTIVHFTINLTKQLHLYIIVHTKKPQHI